MKQHLGVFYEKTSDFQQTMFETLCDAIRAQVPVAEKTAMLDIGAGTGVRTEQAMQLFPNLQRVVAADPDPDMIATAREKHAHPKIGYLQLPAERTGEIEGSFDMALANWALHWVADKDAMFDGLAKVTAPGAHFAFGTCERLPTILVHIDAYIRTEFRVEPNKSPFHYLEKGEWVALLERHGWEATFVEAFTAPHEVESAEVYLDHWFTASAAKFMYGRHLAELSALGRSDLIWAMEREFPSFRYEGGLKFTEDVLFIVAKRK